MVLFGAFDFFLAAHAADYTLTFSHADEAVVYVIHNMQ
jgi:hypothetical protein